MRIGGMGPGSRSLRLACPGRRRLIQFQTVENKRPHSRDANSARAMHERCPLENRGRRECRTLGASAAACAVVESTRVSHHGHAGNVRHSPRNGFNGFFRALPGDRAFLPPSPARIASANLMPASGHQDHTTSPSASAPLVLRRQRVHRIPHPTFVTTAKRPSDRGGMGRVCRDDLPDGESGIFFTEGLDSQSRNQPVGQIRRVGWSLVPAPAAFVAANPVKIRGRSLFRF